MAVIVSTDSPARLLREIKTAISSGNIETWSVDGDGDFTHATAQWRHKAWFRPVVEENALTFNIFPPKSTKIGRTVYAIYHGRLVEMLLSHFDLKFNSARATALPVSGDSV